MVSFRLRKQGQAHPNGGTQALLGHESKRASVQLHAALNDHQPQAGAGPVPHVAAPEKSLKQSIPIRLRDADPPVPDLKERVRTSSASRAEKCARSKGVGLKSSAPASTCPSKSTSSIRSAIRRHASSSSTRSCSSWTRLSKWAMLSDWLLSTLKILAERPREVLKTGGGARRATQYS